jgi:pyruvate dehydrogenase E2 component (dihydrolipoamide acetyltransferase)
MPRLSDTMEEGTINAWLVEDGTIVTSGQEVVEIEGDKATIVVEAGSGGLLTILQPEGSTLAVREPIAWIGDDPPGTDGAEHPVGAAQPPATPAQTEAVAGGGASGNQSAGARAVRVSPVARRLAAEHGVDVSTLAGSGPGGRIVVADVEAAQGAQGGGSRSAGAPARGRPAATSEETDPADGTAATETAKGVPQRLQLSRTQELIARRMATAKATIPDFQAWIDVNMEKALELRARLRDSGAAAPSLNDMIVHAVARSLREFPRVNGSYGDGSVELYPRVNVALAVASEDALYAPTIFDADVKSLAEIAVEARKLTALGREGRLTPAQTAGATFTVSNLGMFGVSGFRAIVSPPQSAILAVGAVERRVVAVQDAVAIRPCLTATLSIDHRIVYGAEAARFLAHLRAQLESPEEER